MDIADDIGHGANPHQDGAEAGMSPPSEAVDDGSSGSSRPTAIPAEDGDVSRPTGAGGVGLKEVELSRFEEEAAVSSPAAVNVTRDDVTNNGDEEEDDEEEGGDEEKSQDEDDNEDDDESDYSYTYEDEDEGHYSGFLIPTDQPVFDTSNNNLSAAAVAGGGNNNNDGDNVNLVASEDVAAAGGGKHQPRTISRAASRSSDAGGGGITGRSSSPIVSETNNPNNERKQKWREPTRAAVNMSLRAEKEKTGGRRRLASDLYKIMMADTQEAGFSLEPADEDCMDKWRIRLFGFDGDSNLAKDLLVCGMDHVELEMSFPDQYPFEPPFVRVVAPRFKRQTGFVMSGALCMELLTRDGWNPINDIESVIVSIRSLMVVGDGRLQAASDMGREKYKKVLDEVRKKKKKAEMEGKMMALGEEEEEDASAGVKGKDDEGEDNGKMGGDVEKRKRSSSDDGAANDGDDAKSGKAKGSAPKRPTGGSYTAAEAQSAYDHISKYHKKEGCEFYIICVIARRLFCCF